MDKDIWNTQKAGFCSLQFPSFSLSSFFLFLWYSYNTLNLETTNRYYGKHTYSQLTILSASFIFIHYPFSIIICFRYDGVRSLETSCPVSFPLLALQPQLTIKCTRTLDPSKHMYTLTVTHTYMIHTHTHSQTHTHTYIIAPNLPPTGLLILHSASRRGNGTEIQARLRIYIGATR